MPFACGSNERKEHPHKRRKLSPVPTTSSTMAKHDDADMEDGHWRFEAGPQHSLSEKMDPRKTEYPAQVVRTSSREELMECIKRGQRPTWIPQPGFQALREREEALSAQRRLKDANVPLGNHYPARPEQKQELSSEDEKHKGAHLLKHQHEPFERPPSALHRGNFAEVDSNLAPEFWSDPAYQPGLAISTSDGLGQSPPRWLSGSPIPTHLDTMPNPRNLSQINTSFMNRRRAPSLGSSLSSSFIMRTPTSPLVQATSNLDLDVHSQDEQLSQSTYRRDGTRRRTMPPNSFHSFSMSPIDATPPNFSRPFAPALRREASLPTQTHFSRKSMSSFTYHPRSNPQTPVPRSRRPSMTSEGGLRRRSSMVGSFEESILRGRMSTPPSKPLDFVAQIGVMGKGDCPSSLKCPAHVSVPFPAVFYSYPASTGTRSVSDDTPSPYVGTIDLNLNLKAITLATKKTRKNTLGRTTTEDDPEALRAKDEPNDTHESPKLHIGGAYRIPQQGQLQIIIKNPNKTAVKLFLVPYDLNGMQPGTKTFVRQRSFSSGPIIENVIGDKQLKSAIVDPLENKHILRYLVHLKFCCPARNRFYLYDDIRVVFANRVPDGKEKLRNEVQLPDPKFSPWKPNNPETVSKVPQSAPSTPTANNFEFESPRFFGDMDDFKMPDLPPSPTPPEKIEYSKRSPPPPFDFPLVSTRSKQIAKDVSNNGSTASSGKTIFEFPDIQPRTTVNASKVERALSPITGFAATTPLRGSPIPWRSPSGGTNSTRSFSPIPVEAGDGLLSRHFKGLNGHNGHSPESRSDQSSEPGRDTIR